MPVRLLLHTVCQAFSGVSSSAIAIAIALLSWTMALFVSAANPYPSTLDQRPIPFIVLRPCFVILGHMG